MADLVWKPEAPITHRVDYSTNVLQSLNGSEQRIARREKPRQSVVYRLLFDDMIQVRRHHTHMFQNLNATWRVPIWWRRQVLTTETGAGSDELRGNFVYSDLSVGDTVILIHPSGSPTHISTLNGVASNLMTMDGGVGPAYPAGSEFYLFQNMRIRPMPQFQKFRKGLEWFNITLDFDGPVELGGAGASLSTFQHSADASAYTLLDKIPLGNDLAQSEYDAAIERVDFGRKFDQFTDIDPSAHIAQHRYSIRSRADLQYWELFLKTVVGGREPFYTPTYRIDIVHTTQPLVVNTPPWGQFDSDDESDTPIDTFDYAGQWFPHSSHKQFRFGTDLGEQYKEVASVIDSGDGTQPITLASGLLANTVISEVSFLERVRLVSDGAAFQHFGPRSTVDIATKVIQRHPDE